jgi:hypothetical protein
MASEMEETGAFEQVAATVLGATTQGALSDYLAPPLFEFYQGAKRDII